MRAKLPLTPAFRRLWLADAISVAGDSLSITTMLLWMYDRSGHSGLWVSAFVVAAMLPQVLAGPLLGRLADQPDRRRLLIRLDLARFALGLTLLATVYYGLVGPALGVVAVMSGAGALFGATQQAALPGSVAPADLPRANAIMALTTQLSFITGPALAAVLMSLTGPVPAILLDALTFLASALVLLGLRLPARETPAGPDRDTEPGSVRPVLHAVRRRPALAVAACGAALLAVSAGVNNTVMVIFMDRALGGRPGDVAWLSGTNGIAQLVMGGAVVALAARMPVARSIATALAVMAVFSVVLAAAPNVPVAVLAVAVVAMANAPFNIAFTTLQQTAVPEHLTGRLFAATAGLGSAAFLVGSLGGGLIADSTSARTAIAISAGCLVLAAVTAASLWRGTGTPAHAQEPLTAR